MGVGVEVLRFCPSQTPPAVSLGSSIFWVSRVNWFTASHAIFSLAVSMPPCCFRMLLATFSPLLIFRWIRSLEVSHSPYTSLEIWDMLAIATSLSSFEARSETEVLKDPMRIIMTATGRTAAMTARPMIFRFRESFIMATHP